MSRSSVNSKPDDQQSKEICQGLARWVCRQRIAPHSVCNGNNPFSLSHLMCGLNPKMQSCLDFETLERNCLKLYDEEKDKVKEVFSELGGQICLSVDSLVDMKQWDRYPCLSAHFINNDWKLQKWVIKYFCRSDFTVFPSVIIRETLREYKIDSKLLTLTDVGANDLADIVKEEFQEQLKLPMNGQLFHVKCCSDIITQMAEKGFEEINEIIDKIRFLSWSNSLPLWYLTTSMLSDALELNASGEFKSAEEDDFYEVPSEEEWEKVRSVCKITDRIYKIINGLFEIKRPTANLFLPHLKEIQAYLTAESTNPDAFTSLVAQKMLEIFNKYWNDTCLLLSIAAFLDPRYKLKFIEICVSDMKTDTLLQNIREIYDGYAVCDKKEYLLSDLDSDYGEDEEGEDKIEGSETRAKKNRCNILENLSILKEYCLSMQSMHDKPRKSDLDLYLEEPTLPWMEHFSVLNWWKDNCFKYPQLSRMARDFLAVTMSLATSYEAYNIEPRKADSTVMNLKPELMNALMCTRSWKLDKND